MPEVPVEGSDNVAGTSCDTERIHPWCVSPYPNQSGGWTGVEARLLYHLRDSPERGERIIWYDARNKGYVNYDEDPTGRVRRDLPWYCKGPCQDTQQVYIDAGFLESASRYWTVYNLYEVGYSDCTFYAFLRSDTCTDAAWGRERHYAGGELECEGLDPAA